MSIIEVDVSKRPICPGCNRADRVEYLEHPPACGFASGEANPQAGGKPSDLSQWFCSRCYACLVALPVKPNGGAIPVTSAERAQICLALALLADPAERIEVLQVLQVLIQKELAWLWGSCEGMPSPATGSSIVIKG